jgi:hypothetical protein
MDNYLSHVFKKKELKEKLISTEEEENKENKEIVFDILTKKGYSITKCYNLPYDVSIETDSGTLFGIIKYDPKGDSIMKDMTDEEESELIKISIKKRTIPVVVNFFSKSNILLLKGITDDITIVLN